MSIKKILLHKLELYSKVICAHSIVEHNKCIVDDVKNRLSNFADYNIYISDAHYVSTLNKCKKRLEARTELYVKSVNLLSTIGTEANVKSVKEAEIRYASIYNSLTDAEKASI